MGSAAQWSAHSWPSARRRPCCCLPCARGLAGPMSRPYSGSRLSPGQRSCRNERPVKIVKVSAISVEGGPVAACRQAFEAAKEGIYALACWNQSRPDGTPHLAAGFALHYGTVAYGNIGSGDRLDFTVIGRDVNLTSRIERLCRELDQQLIMSGEFVARLQEPMFEIGHFALRG